MAFNRDSRSSGGPQFQSGGRDFGRRSFGGNRSSTDRQMFKTTCSKCSKECEVPFKPSGSKPVYCSDCFRSIGGSDSRRSDDRDSRRPSFGNRDSRPGNNGQPQNNAVFDQLNAKLDKILAILNSGSIKPATTPPAPDSTEATEEGEEKIAEKDEQPQPEKPALGPEKKKRSPRKTTALPTTG